MATKRNVTRKRKTTTGRSSPSVGSATAYLVEMNKPSECSACTSRNASIFTLIKGVVETTLVALIVLATAGFFLGIAYALIERALA